MSYELICFYTSIIRPLVRRYVLVVFKLPGSFFIWHTLDALHNLSCPHLDFPDSMQLSSLDGLSPDIDPKTQDVGTQKLYTIAVLLHNMFRSSYGYKLIMFHHIPTCITTHFPWWNCKSQVFDHFSILYTSFCNIFMPATSVISLSSWCHQQTSYNGIPVCPVGHLCTPQRAVVKILVVLFYILHVFIW